MRLMTAEKGAETPLDKYVRFKNNIDLWYQEMTNAGLTEEEQRVLEPYFLRSHGVPPSQEQMMMMLQDENICGFSLKDANTARKIVGKKQMNKIPALQEQVLTSAKSKALGEYVWKCGIGPQMGYSFSIIHALAYSFVGMQTLYLATHFNPVYWNTACLIVNSGALENNAEEEIVSIYALEKEDMKDGVTFEDLPDRTGKIKKTASTDYTKLAKAIGDIRKEGIRVSLVDINHSDFSFKPDAENNQILFGMKGLLNVGDDVINEIIKNRPYESFDDFYERVSLNKQAMISLIKSGAFESFGDRRKIMVSYLWRTCDKKKNLTLSNIPMLLKNNLVPDEYTVEKRIFEFNRYLKSECKFNSTEYKLDDRSRDFLEEIDAGYLTNNEMLNIKAWDKAYKKYMDTLRKWLSDNKDSLLQTVNELAFKEEWNKYAGEGNTSAWEMETMCFYHGKHELADIDMYKYGLSSFFYLPEEPVIEKTFKRGNAVIPIYKLNRICGTCIAKDKVKGTVYLLTTDGVVPVKFRKEYFSIFDKRISGYGEDGKKHILETSWFERGKKIVVQGIRRGDSFIPKKYASSKTHQLLLIDKIEKNGDISLRSERILGDSEDEV